MAVVKFASERIETEWSLDILSPTTKEIAEAWANWLNLRGYTPTITCIFRTMKEEKAAGAKTTLHHNWRAVDFRTKDIPESMVAKACAAVNLAYTYDPARPHLTVAYSAPHGTGPHCHIQSHPATKKRDA